MKILIVLFSVFLGNFAMGIDNVSALNMALDDEYKAFATYTKVIEDFGEVRPFIRIVRSEQRHINKLIPFFKKYGQKVPPNPYAGKVKSYESLAEACKKGVEAEVENVALYDKIFKITDDQELIQVFERLQWASQERHLPAFRRCMERFN